MVFPLYDNNPFAFKSPPYVSWGLIAVNVAVFLYMLSAGASGSYSKTAVILSLAFTPAGIGHHSVIAPAFVPWEFTLVSYAFLYASWLHIIGNMAFLVRHVADRPYARARGCLRFMVYDDRSELIAVHEVAHDVGVRDKAYFREYTVERELFLLARLYVLVADARHDRIAPYLRHDRVPEDLHFRILLNFFLRNRVSL